MNKAQPLRRWPRWLTQFSLRTLLILTTLAAGVFWWLWAPKSHDELLAGNLLKLRRQVRVEPGVNYQWSPVSGVTPSDSPVLTNIGSWALSDLNGDPLVSGHFRGGIVHGRWTTWHPSGQLAAKGQVVQGAKSGIWRTWDEAGTLRGEVTYRATRERVSLPTPYAEWPFQAEPLLVPGMNTPTANQVVGAGFRAARHGPARGWFASGKQEFEGTYQDDLRHGPWTTYDEAGQIVEQGEYRRDKREGEWRCRERPPWRSADAPRIETINYIAGRTQAEHQRLLVRLAEELFSGDLRRQLAAEHLLGELGAAALPVAKRVLADGSDAARLIVLRQLARHDPLPAELLPAIAPLIEHVDPRLALRAMQLAYVLAPDRRAVLWPQIQAALRQALEVKVTRHEAYVHGQLVPYNVTQVNNVELATEVLLHLCDLDTERRPQIFLELVELLAVRKVATRPFVAGAGVNPADYLGIFPETKWALLTRLNTDPLPLVVGCYPHPDQRVRMYLLCVLEKLVERGPAERHHLPGDSLELRWPIPASVQLVIDQALVDPVPELRELAADIGKLHADASHLQRGYGPGFF